MNIAAIRDKFRELYGSSGKLFTSPGRINIIGEHTDYNGGFVLPGAIDKAMYCEIKPNGTGRIRAFALDLGESVEFGLDETDKPEQQWARYIFGVCREMAKRGRNVHGFDTVFAGDVPLGAGMSSSAALESCFGFALNTIYDLGFERFELALIGQSTEHNYVGVMCGIMDQFASCCGRARHLMKLDCRSLEYEYIPFNPAGYRLVLINTMVTHNLAGGEYNKRRQSCERVVEAIAERNPDVKLLRDADMAMLREVREKVDPVDYMRTEFVIEEIARLLDATAAMRKDDYETVGRLMYGTHEGLSRKYEVSCMELDFLVEKARECGVSGSRVMGGGFGGCTINLVRDDHHDAFVETTVKAYNEKFGIAAAVYDVVIGDGAREM